jgi:hypothetical protein
MKLITQTVNRIPFFDAKVRLVNGEITVQHSEHRVRVSTAVYWCPENGALRIINTATCGRLCCQPSGTCWLPKDEVFEWAAFTQEQAEEYTQAAIDQWVYEVQCAVMKHEPNDAALIEEYAREHGITIPDPWDTWNDATPEYDDVITAGDIAAISNGLHAALMDTLALAA